MGRGRMYERQKEFNNRMQFVEHQKTKNIEIKDKFPHCRGTFDTCPTEEDLSSALEKKMAPSVCGSCPVFEKSDVKGLKVMQKPRMSEEDIEFYRRVMGK